MNDMSERPTGFASDEGELNLSFHQLIGAISESRLLVAGIIVACLAIGGFLTVRATPIYQSSAKLLILSSHSSFGLAGLEQLSSLVVGTTTPTKTQIELLKTRSILEPVIRNLNLNVTVEKPHASFFQRLFGSRQGNKVQVHTFEVPQALDGKQFIIKPLSTERYAIISSTGEQIVEGQTGEKLVADVPAGRVEIQLDSLGGRSEPFTIVHNSPDGAVTALRGNLSAAEAGTQTGVIEVDLRGASPVLITRELNELLKQTVAENAKRSVLQAQKQLEFLKGQLPDINDRVVTAQSNLANFMAKHPTIILSQTGAGGGSSYLVSSASMIEQKISALQVEISKLKILSGPQNPQIALLQAQVNELRTQRASAMSSIAKLPEDQQKLIRLQLDATVAQTLYQAVVSQILTLQIAQAGAVGDAVVVEPAHVPAQPISPNHLLDLGRALLIGILLGVGAAYGRRMLHRGIEDPDMLETRLGLPVYAVIPHSKIQERLGRAKQQPQSTVNLLAADPDAENATLETLKSLRTAIQIAMPKEGPRIVCVSSLGPEEGKSFVSSNIGYLLSQSMGKTLLIDGDMRRGHLHKSFSLARVPGLAEVLSGSMPVDSAIRKSGVDNLDLLPTGVLPDDAAALLARARVDLVLAELSNKYDLIVIDLPPVLAVGDAFSIAKYATLHLLLIRYGLHSERQIQLVQRRFERHGIDVHGAILNNVTASAARYAYHQYGYSYNYQYKSEGKAKKKEKDGFWSIWSSGE